MVFVEIIGGLGNQMTQYAFYRQLLHKGYHAKLDIFSFENYKLHNGYELDKIFPNLQVTYSTREQRSRFFNIYQKIVRKLK